VGIDIKKHLIVIEDGDDFMELEPFKYYGNVWRRKYMNLFETN